MNAGKEKIVIMGGSFNPPTLAHYRLMENAIDAVGAAMGYFVPVSDAYLKRKMRHKHPPVVLTEEMRLRMLSAMCSEDCRMRVSDKEFGTVEARTLPTLKSFKEEYPDYGLYFVMGDDKLELLSHLAKKDSFFDTADVILYSRDLGATEDSIREHEVLSAYASSIVALPQPEGTNGISSSLIRERMLSEEPCEELLVPCVWEIFKKLKADDFPDVINSFKGEYDFLSNRFGCSFVWQGIRFNNAETAFQASKFEDEAERRQFSRQSSAKAAMKGGQITPTPEWEESKLETMMLIQIAKFTQNPSLMKQLIATGDCIIINGNNKHETYWGVDLYSWEGENNLGKILMTIREKEKTK